MITTALLLKSIFNTSMTSLLYTQGTSLSFRSIRRLFCEPKKELEAFDEQKTDDIEAHISLVSLPPGGPAQQGKDSGLERVNE